jgi:hypothetical protein
MQSSPVISLTFIAILLSGQAERSMRRMTFDGLCFRHANQRIYSLNGSI